ncbi:uncharacterized protein MONBRDRAFT_33348 [Monosiga brevicollis MX1]|uniref:EF-hand domain-containing protein n=1 Tax=Monosiga brevicollis TaxID=81824 RepID=A9V4W8_MONBE|nr:uncharacterized protein MONBRDRAFT_33348 [Monosiga brevicollis MX1]EDQ87442.1 predicted protein [Monosiga brevicollis MX1]|eukprot:XP_001747702.1 hypothetical protein [Monosiga brevicollis MX1]
MAARLSDKQHADAKAVFVQLAGAKQALSYTEATSALEALGLEIKDVADFDQDKSGSLRYPEFANCVAAAHRTTIVDARLLKAAFKGWDTRDTGYITPKQIMHLMESGSGLPLGISKADVKEMIEYIDRNGDGHIDFDELTKALLA